MSSAPSSNNFFTPFGASSPTSHYGALAPVALSIGNLHVLTNQQGTGKSVTVNLMTTPNFRSSLPRQS